MPFATNGLVSHDHIEGGIKISAALYALAVEGMQAGKIVTIVDGVMVLGYPLPPEPEPVPEPEPEPEPTFAENKAAKFAALASMRFAIETGGMFFNGVPIRTDRETCGIITAAYVSAMNDPAYTVPNWKVADGVFIILDAPTILALSTAVRAHIQSAFDHEAEISAQITAAETQEALDAIDIAAGW